MNIAIHTEKSPRLKGSNPEIYPKILFPIVGEVIAVCGLIVNNSCVVFPNIGYTYLDKSNCTKTTAIDKIPTSLATLLLNAIFFICLFI